MMALGMQQIPKLGNANPREGGITETMMIKLPLKAVF